MAVDARAVDTRAAISQKMDTGGKERVTHISEIFELCFHKIKQQYELDIQR